jgi:hypothetical protein
LLSPLLLFVSRRHPERMFFIPTKIIVILSAPLREESHLLKAASSSCSWPCLPATIFLGGDSMDQPNNSARRNEDIALDLLKFVATTANVGRTTATGAVGFAAPASPKSDDLVAHLLELYTRCLHAVAGK